MHTGKQQALPPDRPMPRHVAIIMDGNGRWAQARGLPREEGHRKGVENVKRIVRCSRDLNLQYLTLYAFSVENWKRPRREVNALMGLLESFLKSQSRELVEKEIRLRVVGQLEGLPDRITRLIGQCVEETASFTRWNLSLALNYGSRSEIVEAVRRYGRDVVSGNADPGSLYWDRLAQYLYTRDLPDPDLVIRTSGEHRISNFLLLQSAYAEYFFTDTYWPDFGPEAFRQTLQAYRRRERPFGFSGEQLQTTAS